MSNEQRKGDALKRIIHSLRFFGGDSRGFSLIELLVVIVVTGVLLGGGLAAYTSFNDRQKVSNSGQQLYNDLRDAQGKAASNEKPETCGSELLEGYQLRFSCESRYVVEVMCGGSVFDIGVTRDLEAGVVLSGGSDEAVKFYILGKGAEDKSFLVWGYGQAYQVDVTTAGEVIEAGLVEGGSASTLLPC